MTPEQEKRLEEIKRLATEQAYDGGFDAIQDLVAMVDALKERIKELENTIYRLMSSGDMS